MKSKINFKKMFDGGMVGAIEALIQLTPPVAIRDT
jgi:hypothetical protein